MNDAIPTRTQGTWCRPHGKHVTNLRSDLWYEFPSSVMILWMACTNYSALCKPMTDAIPKRIQGTLRRPNGKHKYEVGFVIRVSQLIAPSWFYERVAISILRVAMRIRYLNKSCTQYLIIEYREQIRYSKRREVPYCRGRLLMSRFSDISIYWVIVDWSKPCPTST